MPRPALHASPSDRQRAYRERQKAKQKAEARARAFVPSLEAVELLERLWQQNAQAEAVPTSKGHTTWEEQTETLRRLALALGLSLPSLTSKYGENWRDRGHSPNIRGTHEEVSLPVF